MNEYAADAESAIFSTSTFQCIFYLKYLLFMLCVLSVSFHFHDHAVDMFVTK